MILPNLYFKGEFKNYEPLIRKYGGVPVTAAKNTILYDTASEKHASYYICSGLVKHYLSDEEGNECILYFLGPGSIFPITNMGEQFSLENYLLHTAMTELQALRFPSGRLLDMMMESRELAAAVICHMNRTENLLISKNLLSNYNDSVQLISTILYLYNRQQPVNGPAIRLSQEGLGQLTGLSRTQVVRVLKRLREEKIIRIQYKKIEILDLRRLKAYCNSIIEE